MITGTTSTRAVIASLRLERNGIMTPANTVMVASAARIPHAIRLTIPHFPRAPGDRTPRDPVLPVRSTAEDHDVRSTGRVTGRPPGGGECRSGHRSAPDPPGRVEDSPSGHPDGLQSWRAALLASGLKLMRVKEKAWVMSETARETVKGAVIAWR